MPLGYVTNIHNVFYFKNENNGISYNKIEDLICLWHLRGSLIVSYTNCHIFNKNWKEFLEVGDDI